MAKKATKKSAKKAAPKKAKKAFIARPPRRLDPVTKPTKPTKPKLKKPNV